MYPDPQAETALAWTSETSKHCPAATASDKATPPSPSSLFKQTYESVGAAHHHTDRHRHCVNSCSQHPKKSKTTEQKESCNYWQVIIGSTDAYI